MEQQLEKMRTEMKSKQVTGSAGNGMVTVTINGEKRASRNQNQTDLR